MAYKEKKPDVVMAARRGPRPLPAHIMTALPPPGADLPAAVADMLVGIRKYQDHPCRRVVPSLPVVWKSGQAALHLCVADTSVAQMGAIILIPSMINKSYILDLLPERSFVRWLSAQGMDVYLLDWGDAVADEGQTTAEKVIMERLLPAMSYVAGQHGSYCALGYCMGGTLLAGAAVQTPPGLRRAVYLASPWDFHAGNRMLQTQIMMGSASALQMTEQGRPLPTGWIQSVFAAVNADRTIQKFADFATMDQDSDQARLFVVLEDWLNDGVDLPCALARTCIVDWYGRNAPAKGGWQVGGTVVDPGQFRIPSLIVASRTDRLVPADSALALAAAIGAERADILQTDCGHIGMITGRKAHTDVWGPVLNWLTLLQSHAQSQ